MIEFSVRSGEANRQQEPTFSFTIFGNFQGTTELRDKLLAREVTRNNFDDYLASVRPQVTLALELPKVSDQSLTVHFGNLKDFTSKGLLKKVPLLQALKSLRERVIQSHEERALSVTALLEDLPELYQVKEIAAANQGPSGGGTIDLLSLVDIGDEDDGLNLKRLNSFFCASHYAGKERSALLTEIDGLVEFLLRQLAGNTELRQLHGLWRGLRACMGKLPPCVRVSVVDCAKDEICDATYLLYVQQESATPAALDLAVYCEPLAHGEQDRHIIFHLGRMAQNLAVPMILETDITLLGFRNWKQLTHTKDLGSRLEGSGHLKWRQLREEPGSQWLFQAINPVCIGHEEKDAEGPLVTQPASLVMAALLAKPLGDEGLWPGEMLGKDYWVELGAKTAAEISGNQAEDLAYSGLCAVGDNKDGTQVLLGMTSFARLVQRSGAETFNAANLVPYTLPYRFYSGCCARYLQEARGDLSQFRVYANCQGEGALQLEEEDGKRLLRLKPAQRILGITPDLILEA